MRATKQKNSKKKEQQDLLAQEFRRHKALRIASVIALLAVTTWVVIALFSPALPYKLTAPPPALHSDQFLHQLEALTDSRLARNTRILAIPNGENFYTAELQAISRAQRSVNLEAYIFHRGEVAKRFADALAERARAGVRVSLVVDAIGSTTTSKRFFQPLREAGGRVEWYHPIRWNTWMRSNNRTHRELLIIDGKTAFLGGAGIADYWMISKDGNPRWRDNMFRVEGDAVAGLQGTFVENWVEASGELLSGPDYFPVVPSEGEGAPALVVNSTPTSGGFGRARVLFQTLLAAAQKSIYIATPYFLPDKGARKALIQAMRERGVQVTILVPGKRSDHALTRSSSRAAYGDLLQAGARIFEYQPSMMHAKVLIVDGAWVVMGSTNFDQRSFGINDEVNLAARSPELAEKLTADLQRDLEQSRLNTYEQWRRRPVYERLTAALGWVLERQQ